MNTISLIGRLAKEPEPVETKNGTQITNLRLAIDRGAQDGAVYVDVKTFASRLRPAPPISRRAARSP